MSKNDALRSGATGRGFQRWIRLSIDDLPLIRPPTHHMLAHVTGGLKALYEELHKHKDDVKTEENASDKTKEETKSTKGKEKGSGGEDSKKKESEKVSNKSKGQTDEKSENSDKKKKEKENREEKKKESKEEESDKGKPKKSDTAEEEKNDTEDGEKVDHGGGEEGGGGKEDEKEDEEEEDEKDRSDLNSSDKINEDEGSDMEKEDMETTPYTDEEGEFAPEPDMPLLASRYKHIQVLARGQSAIIIKALDTFHSDKPVGIKVLHRVYKPIGSQEADILLELHRADPWLYVPFARLLNQFLYGPHYCLVFEYLSPTPLYNHYELRDIRGKTSIPHVRQLTVKLLTVLGFLYKQNVIHADLKPENILLRDEDDLSSIMVVDFGNALRNTDEELSLYYTDFELQTLLYRAPEVLFGMKFSLEVDMWSLGCLVAECYLGEPLFMGKTKKDVLKKIVDLLGPFPKEFQDGEYAEEFAAFIGRPMSRYQRVENLRKKLKDCKDISFLMFVEKLLTYLPDRRFTPFESACHPFLATIAPFLYLTPSPGYIRYPTVVVDMSMYPYLPGLPDDDDEDTASADGRRRLAQFSHPMPNANRPSLPTGQRQIQPNRKGPHSFGPNMGVTIQGAGNQGRGAGPKGSRPDVQETLKSMGLRCEDFTISVYSREQAHALLRKQGVEVTNHSQAKEKPSHGGKELPKSGKLSTNRASRGAKEDEDDDDCVILDPPDVPKTTGPLPSKLPSQFRLMGTTVQVNRGAKRPSRPAMNQPSAKRSNAYLHAHAHAYHFFDDEDDEEFSDEMDEEVANARADATVQDTLKRLKNYNISITCRGNTGNRDQRIETLDHSSGAEDNHYNESDDDMMANFLECELNEDDEIGEDEDGEIMRDPRRLMASKREKMALLQSKSKLIEKEDNKSSIMKSDESRDDANKSIQEKEGSSEGKEVESSEKEEEEMAQEDKELQEEEKDSSQGEKEEKDQPECDSENVNGKERLETSEDQEENKEEDKLDSAKDEELPEENILEGNEGDEDITEEDELALLKEEVNKLEGKEGGSEWMESLDWDPAKMLEQDEDLESEIV